MTGPILALVEHRAGEADLLSLEALTLARRIAEATGGPLEAVLVGGGAEVAPALGAHGASRVHVVEHEAFAAYAPDAWAAALAQLAEVRSGSAVVAPGSERGTEVLARTAARMGLPMAANVVEVEPGDRYRLTRQRWAGSLLEDAWLDGPVRLLTAAPHAVAVEERPGPAPVVETFTPVLADRDLRVRVTGGEAPDASRISLGDAKVVIGGGRGVGSAAAFATLEELAGLLGAAVGVSRVVTSAGWRPHTEQVGQTGARIAPDLYIACGISGAIQHIVGCKAAKRILAINTDPDAPIMGVADYAVIGDLHRVVPAIAAEIRRRTGG